MSKSIRGIEIPIKTAFFYRLTVYNNYLYGFKHNPNPKKSQNMHYQIFGSAFFFTNLITINTFAR